MSVSDISVRVPLGMILIIIVMAGLAVNILSFLVYIFRRQLRKPPYYFLVHLLIVDILAVVCWTCLSATAAVAGKWSLPFVVCEIQGYIMTFCNLINMHTLTLLAIERCVLVLKPSFHEDSFTGIYTGFFIFSLWLADGVIAVFSVVHWAEMMYSPYQYQCYPDHDKSVSHLNFMFIMTYVFPLVLVFLLYAVSFFNIYDVRRRKVSPSGALVLEVNHSSFGDSYSERLARQQDKFRNAGMRPDKPYLGKSMTFTRHGYIVNDPDNEIVQVPNKVKKKEYFLAKNDYELTKAYFVVTCTYTALWIPYVVLSYIWTYQPRYYLTVGWELTAVFTILTHCGSFVKPIVLVLMVEMFRVSFLKTVIKIKGGKM